MRAYKRIHTVRYNRKTGKIEHFLQVTTTGIVGIKDKIIKDPVQNTVSFINREKKNGFYKYMGAN